VLAVVAIAYIVTRPDNYTYRLSFSDAGQLVNGDLVRIGGTEAGTIQSIRLTSHGLAQVTISLDRSFGPLRHGSTAQIRSPGLISIASRYIDITPAATFKPALRDDAMVPTTATAGIVDIDQVFDALNASTRTGLKRLIRGFGQWYAGESKQANLSAEYFPPALQSYTKLFNDIGGSSATLDQFVDETGKALGTIDAHASQLTDLISQARVTAQALSSDNSSLSEGLENLPGAFENGAKAFQQLRTKALPSLTRLIDTTRPLTGQLSRFLPKLNPVLKSAVPTFKLLGEMFNKPGPDNDLYDALVNLPKLATEVKTDFAEAIKSLNAATPIFEFARPYIADLVAWIDNWDGIFAPYDANGHYASTVPVFDDFSFTNGAKGGELTQVDPDQRGSSAAVSHGNVERCPGGGIVTPADKSAPFIDSGKLSNAHCKPSESVGG
jgi:phospholipid/cholesterol/gamma-HCH transport system substrate-binding protein